MLEYNLQQKNVVNAGSNQFSSKFTVPVSHSGSLFDDYNFAANDSKEYSKLEIPEDDVNTDIIDNIAKQSKEEAKLLKPVSTENSSEKATVSSNLDNDSYNEQMEILVYCINTLYSYAKELNSGEIRERTEEESQNYEYMISALYKDYFDKLYFDKSTNEECIALEKEMADMGVRVTYSDNVEDARLITSAYKDLKEKGYKLPKEVILADMKLQDCGGFTPSPFTEDWEYMPVFYAKGIGEEREDSEFWLEEYGIKYNSTDNPKGPIYHEVGHYLHHYSDNDDITNNQLWTSIVDNDVEYEIAKEVSYYAAASDPYGKEFVGEVFAGIMAGKEYSEGIMWLYNALGGPEIK